MKAEQSCFRCLVAENVGGEIVGIATYFYAYYTWVGKSLYLDDLYVLQAYRGQKVGTSLLAQLFTIAKAENCKRVRGMESHWNQPAIGFYEKCGADIDRGLFIGDFDSSAIEQFPFTA